MVIGGATYIHTRDKIKAATTLARVVGSYGLSTSAASFERLNFHFYSGDSELEAAKVGVITESLDNVVPFID